MESSSTNNKVYSKSCTYLQHNAGILALITSTLSVVYVSLWMNGSDTTQGYLGGLNWNELIFNWHPILMTSGFIMSFIWAALSFRVFQFGKPVNKTIHFLLHSGAVVCFSLGLYAVFQGNNDKSKNTSDSYYPNLYSIHSWMGIGAISLYCLNYVLGALVFFWNVFGSEGKSFFLQHHIALGILLIVMVGITTLSGLADLSTPLCAYAVTEPALNPIEHYKDLSSGCRVANSAGLLVFVTILLTVYALVDIRSDVSTEKHDRNNQVNGEFKRLLV